MYQKYSRVLIVSALFLQLCVFHVAEAASIEIQQFAADSTSSFTLEEGDIAEFTTVKGANYISVSKYLRLISIDGDRVTVELGYPGYGVNALNTASLPAGDAFCHALPSHRTLPMAPLSSFYPSFSTNGATSGSEYESYLKEQYRQSVAFYDEYKKFIDKEDLSDTQSSRDRFCNPPRVVIGKARGGGNASIQTNILGNYIIENVSDDKATFRPMTDEDMKRTLPTNSFAAYYPRVGTIQNCSGGEGTIVCERELGMYGLGSGDIWKLLGNFTTQPIASVRGAKITVMNSSYSASSVSSPTSSSYTAPSTAATTNSPFTIPTRTAGMSQADYLTSVQRAYLGALGQVQSLATRYNQKESEITPVVAGNGTQSQGTTQATAQNTAAQKELSAIGLQIAALQAKIFNRGLAPAGSVGAAQPATPSSAVATGEQGCGNAGYENVGGEWKYVGCSGYYGQGAGNQQTNVAAGYKGADPSNAWDGPNGHYDENGVYHADVKFDRSRDADPDVDVRAGQLGVDYCPLSNGSKTICSVSYYDPEGVKLTQTPFNPAAMLTVMDRFGIDREQLEDLEKGMDKKNIPHLPYQMFPGTGSDAGINLTDLANGGLGTAYDWRVDPLCQSKGPTACQQVKANAQLADNLDIVPTPGVTKTDLTPAEVKLNDIRRQVVEIQAKI